MQPQISASGNFETFCMSAGDIDPYGSIFPGWEFGAPNILSHVVHNRKFVSDLAATLKNLFLGPFLAIICEIPQNWSTSAYISSKKKL